MGSKSTQPSTSKSALIPKHGVRIKKEAPDEEFKEYAETAMNELLGWYGYDKLDSQVAQALKLQHFAHRPCVPASNSTAPGSPSSPIHSDASDSMGSTPPGSPIPRVNVPAGCIACAWCQKIGNAKLFTFKTPGGHKAFCSELCFTQCRRASFKRNKTCDWCRHVRHTVNYVDFQDGDHQLQFCSDKCLNQYKMNIFCKEAHAHLQLHPDAGGSNGSSGGAVTGGGVNSLITPELWMRDCRSESPDSARSSSPPRIPSPLIEIKVSPPSSPPPVVKRPEPTHKLSYSNKLSRKDGKVRRTIKPRRSRVTAPTDIHRANSSSSPRSGGSASPPKHMMPHFPPLPPPHLLPPEHPLHRPPFLPPGFPHLFPPPPHFRKPSQSSPSLPPPLLPINRGMHLPPMLQPPPHLQSLLPPATILVPYPIIIPVPIPIPIPLPLSAFLPKSQPKFNGECPENLSTLSNKTTPPPPPLRTKPPIDTPAMKRTLGKPLVEEGKQKTVLDQPFRKRKRISEVPPDEETSRKQKSVPA